MDLQNQNTKHNDSRDIKIHLLDSVVPLLMSRHINIVRQQNCDGASLNRAILSMVKYPLQRNEKRIQYYMQLVNCKVVESRVPSGGITLFA